jgi:hypothetical protein
LPSATLSKACAECFSGFAECFKHSVKMSIPVVYVDLQVPFWDNYKSVFYNY